MKKYLQGVFTGVAAVSIIWASVFFWNHLKIPESYHVMSVTKLIINDRLKDGEFLAIDGYSETPLYTQNFNDTPESRSAAEKKCKMLSVNVIYRKNNQIKRMVMPIARIDDFYTPPPADSLEKMDIDAKIIFEESNKTNQGTARMLAVPDR